MVPNRKLSISTFGFALFCFLLPFVTVSCGGVELTFSGLELVTGTSIETPSAFGQVETEEVSGEPLAVFALICVLLGLALAIFSKGHPRVFLILGLGGVVFLVLLAFKLGADLDARGEPILSLSFRFGFYLCLLSLLTIAAVSGYGVRRLRPEKPAEAPQPPP